METYYQIDRYLNGELSGEELGSFEKRLKNDLSFADEVAQQRAVNEVVMGASFDSLRNQMQQDLHRLDQASKTKWWISGMAGLLALGAAVFFYTHTSTEKNTLSQKTKEQQISENTSVSTEQPEKKNEYAAPSIKSNAKKNTGVTPDVPQEEVRNEVAEQPETSAPVTEEKTETTPPAVNPFYSAPSEIQKVNCDEVKISATPSIEPTCKGEPNGTLILYSDKIKGGTAPYSVGLDEKALQQREVFTGLDAGTHTLLIKDKSGCISSHEITIPEKDCHKLNKFTVQPETGEVWKLPVPESASGNFYIHSSSGLQVYKSAFGNNGVSEWNAYDQSGNPLPAGIYVYIIEYSTGKKENGQITINR